jgi:uroporphyrinogen-III decarboxylase
MTKLAKGTLYARGVRLGSLDGFERVIAGIYGRPDRVPLLLQPYTYAMAMHGLTSDRFFRDAEPFINASWNMANYFGVDFWSPVFDFYNIELDALGQKLIWRGNSEPDVDTSAPLIASPSDLDRLRPPVPGTSGRMPYVLESYRRYMDVMGLPPMCYCCSPFTMAVLIRGYVNFLRDMKRTPAFAHRLMEFLSMEVVVPWVDKMVEVTNASIVVMSDAWASAPNMTTAMVREFCLPYVQKVIKATNSAMRTVVDSGSWGEKETADPREILDIKMDMMAGNPVKPLRPFFLLVWNEDYEVVGIQKIRKYAEEKKVCLMLNIRPNLLEEGPREAIVRTVKGLIHEGAGDGRFVLLINLVPVGTPVEHVHTAVAAVRQFGGYPIQPGFEDSAFEPPEFQPWDTWFRRNGLPV